MLREELNAQPSCSFTGSKWLISERRLGGGVCGPGEEKLGKQVAGAKITYRGPVLNKARFLTGELTRNLLNLTGSTPWVGGCGCERASRKKDHPGNVSHSLLPYGKGGRFSHPESQKMPCDDTTSTQKNTKEQERSSPDLSPLCMLPAPSIAMIEP